MQSVRSAVLALPTDLAGVHPLDAHRPTHDHVHAGAGLVLWQHHLAGHEVPVPAAGLQVGDDARRQPTDQR